jgi:hypothetical protein
MLSRTYIYIYIYGEAFDRYEGISKQLIYIMFVLNCWNFFFFFLVSLIVRLLLILEVCQFIFFLVVHVFYANQWRLLRGVRHLHHTKNTL